MVGLVGVRDGPGDAEQLLNVMPELVPDEVGLGGTPHSGLIQQVGEEPQVEIYGLVRGQ